MSQNPYVHNPYSKESVPSPYTPSNEVFDFLRSLELEDYYTSFIQGHIHSLATLSKLKAEDLKEIGLPVGPRRIVLSEIQSWNNTNSSQADFMNYNNNNNINNNTFPPQFHSPEPQFISTTTPTTSSMPNNHRAHLMDNNNTDNNYTEDNTPKELPPGTYDTTIRPWVWCLFGIVFALPFPFFCFGLAFHFCGETQHYSFDNNRKVLEFYQFRGTCCYCLDNEAASIDYSDIKCVRAELYSQPVNNGIPLSKIEVVLHSGTIHKLFSNSSSRIGANREAHTISQFTGIPFENRENRNARTML